MITSPSRPLFKAEEDIDFRPLSSLEWNYIMALSSDDPAGPGSSVEATMAGQIQDPANADIAGSSEKGKDIASS